MDRDRLIQRLMATFLEELEEHVAALNRDLLALEKGPAKEERAERLRTLFRTVHSLKGAARSVSVPLIESACHHLEEILSAARDGRRPLDAGLFPLLFATADAIEEAGMRLREQHDLTAAPLSALVPQLEAAVAGTWEPAPERAAAPDVTTDVPPVSGASAGQPLPTTAAAMGGPPVVGAPPAAELPAEAPSGPATVRIPAEKLDGFLARSGELLVARRRVQARAQDLDGIREFVGRWRSEWGVVEKALGQLQQNGAAPLPRRVGQALSRAGENLRQLERDLEHLGAGMTADGRVLKQSADALNDEVRRVRMLPFADACQGLERLVRDLAHAGGKEVELVIEGGAVELDRSVLEGLKDPLRHLVRNAVDHGGEPPEARRAAGKPSATRVRVAAVLRGSQVEVVVSDDGRGLDLEALRRQLRKRHLPELSDERELARAVFLPGLSTAPLITDVSGRGVGLDVVRSRVESLHGTVDVSFTPGRGTRFTLAAPLTLTTLRAVLVGAGGQTFAFVGTNVQRLVRIDPAALRTVEGREMLALGGPPLPLASLADTLGLPSPVPAVDGGRVPALVVAAGDRRAVFSVDEFLAEQEIVIKGLGSRIRRLRHVAGGTLLPSGQVALVLNAANLVRTALARLPSRAVAPVEGAAGPARQRILIADDSLTTRTLEKSILEAAGYEVAVTPDGAAAWQLLHERGADLLVSDVEMPRMDGFALTEAVRASQRFRELPVVLVTARGSDEDRARGIAVGADAYLRKSAFDQKNLLETIAQLL
jgi:two-component system chemotaxis sensor kinase CheA